MFVQSSVNLLPRDDGTCGREMTEEVFSPLIKVSFFFFFIAPAECGSSQARDRTHAKAVIPPAAETTSDPLPLGHQGIP